MFEANYRQLKWDFYIGTGIKLLRAPNKQYLKLFFIVFLVLP